MISLQTLLAAASFKENLPLYGIIAGAVILLCVFISGMVKGFFRVGKGGFTWAIAGAGFIAAYKLAPNPLKNVLKTGFLKENVGIVWALALLLGIVIVVLIARAALGAIFGSDVRKAEERATTVEASTEGFEYELDDVVEGYYGKPKSKYQIARESHPGILSRLFGGIVALLNLAIVLAIIAGVALFIIDALKIAGGVNGILGASAGDLIHKYVMPYVLDFITVGIIFGIGCHGFYAGTIGFTRNLLMKLGTLVVIILGLAAPFIKPFSQMEFIDTLVVRCAGLFNKVTIISNGLLGQITTGVLLAVVGVILMAIINLLLKKLIEIIENIFILRIIDGVLATVIYLALAVVLCGVLWGSLFLLDSCGIFQVRELLAEKSFSLECFNTAENLLGGIASKLKKFA